MPLEKKRLAPGVFEVNGRCICFYHMSAEVEELAYELSTREIEEKLKDIGETDLYSYLLNLRDKAREDYLETRREKKGVK